MSSIIIVTGRVTADPVMQQAKNSGAEYISLGLATNQRGPNGKDEPIFYQCYCSKFLADRLLKAGVKKSTCLMVYGDLELHPYIHQKGNNAGQAGITPQILVKGFIFFIKGSPQGKKKSPLSGAYPGYYLRTSWRLCIGIQRFFSSYLSNYIKGV